MYMAGNEPTRVNGMARDGRIPGNRITSQFYDPFYYLPAGYRYSDHPGVAGPLMQCWLANTRTRLMLLSPPGPLSQSVPNYLAFIGEHPGWFTEVRLADANGWSVFAVDVPAPAVGECK